MPETLYSISDTTLTGLANAVRNKTGQANQLSPTDMINDVSDLLVYDVILSNLYLSNGLATGSEETFSYREVGCDIKTNYGDNVQADSCTYKLYINNSLVSQGNSILNWEVEGEQYSEDAFKNGQGSFTISLPFEIVEVLEDEEPDYPGLGHISSIKLILTLTKGQRVFEKEITISNWPLYCDNAVKEQNIQQYPGYTNLYTETELQNATSFDLYDKEALLAIYNRLPQGE